MGSPRARSVDTVINRLLQQHYRLGQDARSVRLALGWTQAKVARRARISQASVARMEAGGIKLSIQIAERIFAALGMDLSLKAYPGAGVRLRDSGQLALAESLRGRAHPAWRVMFEAPTSEDGRQAADMLFLGFSGAIHLELEARLADFQAQLRRAQLKRDALQHRHECRVALVMGLRDTEHNRAAAAANVGVIRAALPASSREILASIREGRPLQRDGLLWIRAANAAHPRRIP
jgi:Predicted transcriptional regulator with C-terminal CBS domains